LRHRLRRIRNSDQSRSEMAGEVHPRVAPASLIQDCHRKSPNILIKHITATRRPEAREDVKPVCAIPAAPYRASWRIRRR
jgi:hypothetical protein